MKESKRLHKERKNIFNPPFAHGFNYIAYDFPTFQGGSA
jgi:hypothetical protein